MIGIVSLEGAMMDSCMRIERICEPKECFMHDESMQEPFEQGCIQYARDSKDKKDHNVCGRVTGLDCKDSRVDILSENNKQEMFVPHILCMTNIQMSRKKENTIDVEIMDANGQLLQLLLR